MWFPLYQQKGATDVQKSKIVAIKYVMETLKNQSASKPDQNVLPYRTYIWEGGKGVDVNKDGKIKDIAANPGATPPVVAVVETTIPWCFKYGEEEWMNPFSVSSSTVIDGVPVTTSKGATFDDYFDEAKDNENLQISCN